jgi:hypothetical protein
MQSSDLWDLEAKISAFSSFILNKEFTDREGKPPAGRE